MTDRSPHTAFGLRAQALALKAKTGARVNLAEVVDVAAYWHALLPGDDAAGAAVARFLAELHIDQAAAGEALLAFLETWLSARGVSDSRDLIRRPEAVLAEIACARPVPAAPRRATPPADWQTRKDCGLD